MLLLFPVRLFSTLVICPDLSRSNGESSDRPFRRGTSKEELNRIFSTPDPWPPDSPSSWL
jgi:hypothetical protein